MAPGERKKDGVFKIKIFIQDEKIIGNVFVRAHLVTESILVEPTVWDMKPLLEDVFHTPG